MSQIDKIIYFPLLFWFFILMLFFYTHLYSYFLNDFIHILKSRLIWFTDARDLAWSSDHWDFVFFDIMKVYVFVIFIFIFNCLKMIRQINIIQKHKKFYKINYLRIALASIGRP